MVSKIHLKIAFILGLLGQNIKVSWKFKVNSSGLIFIEFSFLSQKRDDDKKYLFMFTCVNTNTHMCLHACV